MLPVISTLTNSWVYSISSTPSTIEFPANQYMAYMDHAEWKMEEATVDIKHNMEGEAFMVSTSLTGYLDFTAGLPASHSHLASLRPLMYLK